MCSVNRLFDSIIRNIEYQKRGRINRLTDYPVNRFAINSNRTGHIRSKAGLEISSSATKILRRTRENAQ